MVETGIDIVEVARVQQAIIQHGDHFLKKIFHPKEIAYCEAKTRKYEHYAARFAAKEACRKALLSHLSYHPAWTDMFIVNDPGGKPFLHLDEKIMKILTIRHISVSLSHTQTLATAIVFFEIGVK
ncbi:MAG: holo-[acyl-carrier protein] synthase [Candidatus Marinimicrobia bacterium]|jgi:holo-[acyl-carrier protein] synthase|nr:holo-[acyl-carrier protein] synthase [Candidatus Neomarinimicrobiota bacterium]